MSTYCEEVSNQGKYKAGTAERGWRGGWKMFSAYYNLGDVDDLSINRLRSDVIIRFTNRSTHPVNSDLLVNASISLQKNVINHWTRTANKHRTYFF